MSQSATPLTPGDLSTSSSISVLNGGALTGIDLERDDNPDFRTRDYAATGDFSGFLRVNRNFGTAVAPHPVGAAPGFFLDFTANSALDLSSFVLSFGSSTTAGSGVGTAGLGDVGYLIQEIDLLGAIVSTVAAAQTGQLSFDGSSFLSQSFDLSGGLIASSDYRLTIYMDDAVNSVGEFNVFPVFSSLNISAVPEPSTYAMIFGALALSFTAYCRKVSAK